MDDLQADVRGAGLGTIGVYWTRVADALQASNKDDSQGEKGQKASVIGRKRK